jgi:hypothetical protein
VAVKLCLAVAKRDHIGGNAFDPGGQAFLQTGNLFRLPLRRLDRGRLADDPGASGSSSSPASSMSTFAPRASSAWAQAAPRGPEPMTQCIFFFAPTAVAQWKQNEAGLQADLNLGLIIFGMEKPAGVNNNPARFS